ncbi:MAG: cell division protein FtsZ [Flavobacteriaceae bacterium]|nr:cell division protein FtsZ [Flavobacteriaceae bacterium]
MKAENLKKILFDMPKSRSNTIKVIGVGGGGSSAVNYMYNESIKGVDFVICNTDLQDLESSPIANKVQLGISLTEGLGAGANPSVGAEAAEESIEEIKKMLTVHTKMVFITAGMGGGTGTGSAPIIAKIAKDMGILTIGIVTSPFSFEGRRRTQQAEKGIEELRASVDSLIVINNNKLREVYGNVTKTEAFSKSDEVLSTAVKGIAEVITHHYKQNIDLHDAKTVLSKSGTAIMGSAKASGDNRAKEVIINALDSPLLNDSKITGAKNVLLLIVSGTDEVTLDEIAYISEYIQKEAGYEANIIMGIGDDDSLEDSVSVTVVATGFASGQQHTIGSVSNKRIIHNLENEQRLNYNFDAKIEKVEHIEPKKIIHRFLDDEDDKDIDTISNTQETIEPVSTKELLVEDDFVITTTAIKPEPSSTDDNRQMKLQFDLPIKNTDLTNKLDEQLQVEEEEEISEVIEQLVSESPQGDDSDGKIYLSLEDEPEVDTSTYDGFVLKTKKLESKPVKIAIDNDSPLNKSIEELKDLSSERINKMSMLSSKRNNSSNDQYVDDLEKEPAYKRLGLDVESRELENSRSRSSVEIDENNELYIRTNNTFLHDNVD